MTSVGVSLRSRLLSEAVASELSSRCGTACRAVDLSDAHSVAPAHVDVLVLDARASRRAAPEMLSGSSIVLLGRREEDGGGHPDVVARVPPDVDLDRLADVVACAIAGQATDEGVGQARSRYRRRATDGVTILSPREEQVLGLLARAAPTQDIAAEIGVSVHTVRTHVQNILGKLDAHSKVDAVARARALGLLERGR